MPCRRHPATTAYRRPELESGGHRSQDRENRRPLAARAIQDEMRIENWCYGCGPLNPDGLQIKSYWEGDQALCTYQPRAAFMAGPRHVLNGGIIATLIDCHSICTAIAAIYEAERRPIGSDPL